jgi:hypothetical protein
VVGQVLNGVPEGVHHSLAISAGTARGRNTCALGLNKRKQHNLRTVPAATYLLWVRNFSLPKQFLLLQSLY